MRQPRRPPRRVVSSLFRILLNSSILLIILLALFMCTTSSYSTLHTLHSQIPSAATMRALSEPSKSLHFRVAAGQTTRRGGRPPRGSPADAVRSPKATPGPKRSKPMQTVKMLMVMRVQTTTTRTTRTTMKAMMRTTTTTRRRRGTTARQGQAEAQFRLRFRRLCRDQAALLVCARARGARTTTTPTARPPNECASRPT